MSKTSEIDGTPLVNSVSGDYSYQAINKASDPVHNLVSLIRCPSITPDEGGALSVLQSLLEPLGFTVERPVFSETGTADVENLYARLQGTGSHLMFAGHTDVVPPGDLHNWVHPPFEAAIVDGEIFGRGAVDMKGGIACFLAATARYLQNNPEAKPNLSFLITGDEEGPAINGSSKLLHWARNKGESWDACIVGEPTNPDKLGEMIKIGRRGSAGGALHVYGTQGHVAYPHNANNPIPYLIKLLSGLLSPQFDQGTADFQPSNLEITSIDAGNPASNVIPAKATAVFNIRFNDRWSPETLKTEVLRRLQQSTPQTTVATEQINPIRFEVEWNEEPSQVFLTRDARLTSILQNAIQTITGRTAALSTSGGTSDARYIKDYCPVLEFGLVGQSMHMANERTSLHDLEKLTEIYHHFITEFFKS